MRILITGKKGQVGKCLVEQLNRLPEITFLALDRAELDITNEVQVNRVVGEFKPNVIINAAAYTAVDKAESEINLAYAVNRDGPKFLAEAAERNSALILHISTDYVFSGNKKGTYSEADTTSPQGIYGESKLAGEKAVIKACSRHIIIRTAWVFGEHGNNFVKTMLRLAQTRDVLGVVGDQFGGPTYAGDIASALIKIANTIINGKSNCYGIYHFSGLPHVSWSEFANAIFEQAKKQKVIETSQKVESITTAEYPTTAKRPQNSKLDTTLINHTFWVQPSNWKIALLNLTPYLVK